MARNLILESIARNKAKIAELKAHGAERMSKTGVKWCCWSLREQNKRMRRELSAPASPPQSD